MHLDYSTDAVGPSERFAYWTDVVCQHLIPARCVVPERTHFNARFSAGTLGRLTLAQMSSPRHIWERDAQHLRREPNEDFMLSLMVAGQGVLAQSGRQVVQGDGDIALFDAARPFTFDLAPESVLLLRIPRKQLLCRMPQAHNLGPIQLERGHSMVRLLGHMVHEAGALQLAGHAGVQASLAGSLLDLLSATLQWHIAGTPATLSAHSALFQKARDYMLVHLDDCELSIAQIASVHNVSVRTLARAFAVHGSRPIQWLWQQRLEASYCALREGRVRQVTQAAFQYGFSDVSHFCRVFKKAYGVTPHTAARTGGHSPHP